MAPVSIKHNVYENAIVLIHYGWRDFLWRALYTLDNIIPNTASERVFQCYHGSVIHRFYPWISSRILIQVSPNQFSPFHRFFLKMSGSFMVIPAPHFVLYLLASTNDVFPVANKKSIKSGFCSIFSLQIRYICSLARLGSVCQLLYRPHDTIYPA